MPEEARGRLVEALVGLAADELAADLPGAIVITGGERIFAAGADISQFGGQEEARSIGPAFHRTIDAIAALPRFVIAAVSGYALGGGCELALGCDYRIASGGGRMVVTMDRYQADWAMVERGWRTHVEGVERGFKSAREAIATLRQRAEAIAASVGDEAPEVPQGDAMNG